VHGKRKVRPDRPALASRSCLNLVLVISSFIPAGRSPSGGPVEAAAQTIPPPVPAAEWEHTHEGPYGEAFLRVERGVRCNCGCRLDVHMCQFQMQCGTSPEWSRRILRQLEEGESEEAILASFAADFGPSVLMALPREGFNWVGYLLPWAAILSGVAGVAALLRRREGRARNGAAGSDLTTAEWERIREELGRLEEEERESEY
jgi:hypothetical protein